DPDVSPTVARGKAARDVAAQALDDAGFTVTDRAKRVRGTGVVVPFVATDAAGAAWWFDVPGGVTAHRGGVARPDAVWKALGRATALRSERPLVLLTTALPRPGSEGDLALRSAGPDVVFD